MHYPSALANHLACSHLTKLEHQVKAGKLKRPTFHDPVREALIQRGFAHEDAYIAHLRDQGLSISEPAELDEKGREDYGAAAKRLQEAMTAGTDVITQAHLSHNNWHGYADVLRKTDTPSTLGRHSYEPVDTKLTRTTKGATLLQLTIYALILEHLQGIRPDRVHVVTPGTNFQPETYRTAEFAAYTRLAQRTLEGFDSEQATTYPDPVAHCQLCDWWQECLKRRRDDDHPTIVAGLSKRHAHELELQGIATLSALAETTDLAKPTHGSIDTLLRLREQARVQARGRETDSPQYDLIPPTEGKGLYLLPEPDGGDIYFDIESARLMEPDGLEYLLGFSYQSDADKLTFTGYWSENLSEEKQAFERFIDFVFERLTHYPNLHIYHFGVYETAAIKRMMQRHATREEEVDQLLRGGRFVDLHRITRQGVRASVEQYSLKDLEAFCGFERAQNLREASRARHAFEAALDTGIAGDFDTEAKVKIERYNEEDCLSTLALRDWLEARRDEHLDAGVEMPRPEFADGEAPEAVRERAAEIQAIADDLLQGVPEFEEDRGPEQQARWLLANLLPYYQREAKVGWWEFFRLSELDDEEIEGERHAVIGLEFVDRVGGSDRCPIHRYRYPRQELALKHGTDLKDPDTAEPGESPPQLGSVDAIDFGASTIDIKKTGAMATRHPRSVFGHTMISAGILEESLLEFGRHVAAHGFDAEGPWQTASDLLLRRAPRLHAATNGPLRKPDESTLDAAKRLCTDLDRSILPIQGPPGTGKTFTAAHAIVDLLGQGKKVGITAVSHKVIENLLCRVVEFATKAGVDIDCMQKPKSSSKADLPPGIERAKSTDSIADRLRADNPVVIGATGWTWASDKLEGLLDYLFVDEAGQLSLAHTLACGRATTNLVLVGDPQQLEQPQQGAHPDGCDVAALVHLLGEHDTVPEDKGLFLDVTWRLHPSIANYTSALFYDGRLESHPDCERQRLAGVGRFDGSGMHWVPVEHEGNQSRSSEEVAVVTELVKELTGDGASWVDMNGLEAPLTEVDILVVAPYNLQVNAIQEAVPGVRVGTVDKFQGQEAPVVIYSMTSSSAEDAPRGMGFLYDPHRLNVATSRARCAVIVVGSPRVCEAVCSTPDQMRRVNGVCEVVARGG